MRKQTTARAAHHAARPARTALLAGVAATVLLGIAGTAVAGQAAGQGPGQGSGGAPGAPAAPAAAERAGAGDVSVRGGLELRVVRPYESFPVGAGAVMGLLPVGEQNYVVSAPEAFDESVAQAREYVGDQLRPDSLSAGVQSENGEEQLIYGAWRLAEAPREIVIVPEGADWGYGAQLVTLPGQPGWGTYHLDVTGIELPDSYTVVGYDADGQVFDEIGIAPVQS